MGGHGATSIYLRSLLSSASPAYRSCSAFAPILNPTKGAWGIKAFTGYLKDGITEGESWDSTVLINRLGEMESRKEMLRVLIDVGTADDFYNQGQLLPETFERAVASLNLDKDQDGTEKVSVNYRGGYDHSYYFISSFFEVGIFGVTCSAS